MSPRSRSFHGTKDSAVLVAIGNTATSECCFGHSQQGDEDAQHGEDFGILLPKFENLRLQRTLGHPGDVESDNISRWETRPISGRRAGDTISKRELDVASVVNETPESVVVTSTSSMSFHASMIRADVIGASLSPFVRCRSSNESVPQVELRV